MSISNHVQLMYLLLLDWLRNTLSRYDILNAYHSPDLLAEYRVYQNVGSSYFIYPVGTVRVNTTSLAFSLNQ